MAELSNQPTLPDIGGTEAKPEVKDEDDDSKSGKKQTGGKMEVSMSFNTDKGKKDTSSVQFTFPRVKCIKYSIVHVCSCSRMMKPNPQR